MLQDLTLEEWASLRNTKELTLIDVRSPSEFEEATIPGSLNIPIFDDAERAEIGTLYKQTSIHAAKERGLEIVSAKLPSFVRSFGRIPGKKAVFCWRGGMRSRTTATLLSLMDIRVYRLIGGYKAYRKWVIDSLESIPFESPAFILQGLTGCGKTAVLSALQDQGAAVLDLERLAGHRGSIFGHIGLKAHNQKTFDSLLLDEMLHIHKAPYVILEAESKRIGKVVLPDFLMRKKEEGTQILLELPLKARVDQILKDYRPWENHEACLLAFHKIKSRIHTPVAAEIEQSLKDSKYERAVELLLEYYYDPRYEHSFDQYEPMNKAVIQADSVDEAIQAVEAVILNKQRESEDQRAH